MEKPYELTWPGKDEAKSLHLRNSDCFLKYVPEASLFPEATKNIYIEGDNLEAMSLLKTQYGGAVKMIYIDPPYNTGKSFIYRDSFPQGYPGDTHSGWLNMMYPRLCLAREMLREDGFIFISIDNNELANLKLICDEIFGEKNFVDMFSWTKTSTPHSLSPKSRRTLEYILCYEKKLSNSKFFGSPLQNLDAPLLNGANPVKTLSFPAGSIHFGAGRDVYSKGSRGGVEFINDVRVLKGVNPEEAVLKGRFKWSQEKVIQEVSEGTYFLIKSDKLSIRYQRPESAAAFKPPTSYLNADMEIGTNESAVKELSDLGLEGIFHYPKPLSLLCNLIRMCCFNDPDCLIMDFFSGSGSTAQAVMLQNLYEAATRSFIMIQSPEPCAPDSKAYLSGFENIAQIGAERLRRAAEKIKTLESEKYKERQAADLGFRFYRVSLAQHSSNPPHKV